MHEIAGWGCMKWLGIHETVETNGMADRGIMKCLRHAQQCRAQNCGSPKQGRASNKLDTLTSAWVHTQQPGVTAFAMHAGRMMRQVTWT